MTPDKPLPAHLIVAELLEARRFSIAALTGRPGGSPSVSSPVWEFFLSLERCAGLVLDSPGTNIPPDAAGPLRAAAARGAQSGLQARMEGRYLSDIASRLNFPVVVLKGGVLAVAGRGPALPLVDIDILVQQKHVDELCRLLTEAGFGSPSRATEHHVGFVPAPGRLAVELHWTTNDDGTPVDPDIWDRLQPVEGVPHLKRLAPRDNLEHLLKHAVIVHRQRSVSIRDAYLTGLAASECNPQELSAIEKKLAGDRHSRALLDLLKFSRRLRGREDTSPADPFLNECATFYSAMVLAERGRVTSPAATAFMMEIALGRMTRAQATKAALRFRGTGHESLSRIASTSPRLFEPLLGVAHVVYYTMVSAAMLPRIRQTAAKALARASLSNR